jgi:histidinol-phosphate phosphatase family protein
VTEKPLGLRPTIFLDRDGVLIENRDEYVRSWADVAFIPRVLGALAEMAASDYALVVVSNQAAVGKGLVAAEIVEAIHERLQAEVTRAGGRLDALYYCPHTDADQCDCRKPRPGLLLRAARDHRLDLARSWMIGDALTDLQAGETAGARSLLVLTGRGQAQQKMHRLQGFADLAEALAYIRSAQASRPG